MRRFPLFVALLVALSACSTPQAGVQPTLTMETAPTSVAAEPRPTEEPQFTGPTPTFARPLRPTSKELTPGPPATFTAPIRPTLERPVPRAPAVEGEVIVELDRNIRDFSHFRIGGDGSIRVLDHQNHQLIYFHADGSLSHTVPFATDAIQGSFIVNPQAEVFVMETVGGGGAQRVRRYSQSGEVLQELPLAERMLGTLSLTADQMLVVEFQGRHTTLIIDEQVVPPQVQNKTNSPGITTPRSPLVFEFVPQRDLATDSYSRLSVHDPVKGNQLTAVEPQVFLQSIFVNIDRAMNLYFSSEVDRGTLVIRTDPQGNFVGGAAIKEPGCTLGNNTLYIDQVGTVWTMCGDEQHTIFKRYRLVDAQSQPLPDVPAEPADVIWRPGAERNLSFG